MSDLAYALIVLAVPFLFGIAIGIGIANRRPAPNSHALGEHVAAACAKVTSSRLFVGEGCDVYVPIEAEAAGKKFQIIVREMA